MVENEQMSVGRDKGIEPGGVQSRITMASEAVIPESKFGDEYGNTSHQI